MSLVADVDVYLGTLSLDANTFRGRLPESPDSATALIPYAGRAALFVHNLPTISIDRPALQVLCRAKTFADAEARASALYAVLSAVVNLDLNGTRYQRIEPLGSPFLLERDANDRTVFAMNLYVMKKP